MSNWIPKDLVNNYLLRIKDTVVKDRYKFINRRKNINSLARVGLMPKDRKDIILSLTYLDYFNGPEDEKDPNFPSGEYMFFGCTIDNYEFFIKTKLYINDNKESCLCMSFHIAEGPIIYPFKQ